LFVANLLVRDKVLKMIDQLFSALPGLFQDLGKRAGRRRGDSRKASVHPGRIPV
jgi:hypothetical protein